MMERKGGLERREKKGDGVCAAFMDQKGSRRVKARRGLSP